MLDAAREIFCDNDAPLHQRIEAAAIVLQHDAPNDLIADATEFLQAVANSNAVTGYRLDAIKALAKRIVPKAVVPGASADRIDWRRGRWQAAAAADRKLALMRAGEWPPVGGEGKPGKAGLWARDIYSDDWIEPEGDPPGWKPGSGIAEFIEWGRKRKYTDEGSLTPEQRQKIEEREKMLAARDQKDSDRE